MAALHQRHKQHIKNKTKMPILPNQPQSNITKTNSPLRTNVCRLVFFSNAAASAAAPASPTSSSDHGGASEATKTTHHSSPS
jgi:hypothetical protein